MRAPRTLLHVMRADFRERSRRYSFLITIGLMVLAAYLALPPSSADYLMMGLGHYRGVYNSAWTGAAVAVICSSLLSLPAFYLVKNAIERDERTGVGQILATTPLTKPLYMLGKTFSNFVFMAVMVGVIALAAGGMQLVRGEVFHIDPWGLLSPFILSVLPAMAVVSAIAVLFESISWLRGTAGNVIYMVLWMALLISFGVQTSSRHRAIVPAYDLWGIRPIVSSMMSGAAAEFPDYDMHSFAISAARLQQPLQTFTWQGVNWTAGIILGRVMWLGVAVGVSLLAALLFRRFDPAPQKPARRRKGEISAEPAFEEVPFTPLLAPVPLSRLISSRYAFRPLPIFLAELRLLLKGIRWWWLILFAGLIVAGITLPLEAARQFILPAAWALPLAIWSGLGIREKQHNTGQLVFSASHFLGRQFPMLWLAGVAVSIAAAAGVALNIIAAGDWSHLAALSTGALFIPSLALALGTWSGTNKAFEVVYMVWWYTGPVNRMEWLDFMGTRAGLQMNMVWMYGLLTILLLALAAVGRKRQMKR